jgi:3-(3-hydroxy-phenyl)propionate hydroxylase
MGQGMCSGLRDAANLAWKVALVLSGDADAALLDTYEQERRPHAEAMAKTSVQMGKVFLARTRGAAWARDTVLRAIQTIPRVRRFLRNFEFKPLPAHEAGLMATGRRRGPEGAMFPQPRVLVPGATTPVLLDEVLGAGFAVLGPGVGPELAADPRWHGLPVRFLRVRPFFAAPAGDGADADGVDEIADVDGVLTKWFDRNRAAVVVLRPDRFVYGAARAADAGQLAASLTARLRPAVLT